MDRLWKSDLGNGRFVNPVLFADYSDPDVIRVNDTYYMTASSFNYIPGLPILTSRDLINWELVNYAVSNINAPGYDRPRHSCGIWAPSIRYHKDTFYIVYGMPDEGIYVVKTKDPLGKWDEPLLLLPGKGLIDSCPFWDEDGRTYIVHGYAKSRIGFNSYLGIFEVNETLDKVLSEDHLIYNGSLTQKTIEGPKTYKRDGKYYILAPAGGVKQGWQVALRSDSIHGPYEEMIVMKQGSSDINGPHQGGLIDTVNGEEWFMHFQDMGLYGRVCVLQPVTWKDGWPCMGINIEGYCGEPARELPKPDTGVNVTPCYLDASDDFNSDKLGLCWQWTGNSRSDFYSLTNKPNSLTLNAISVNNEPRDILWNRANVLTQKVVCPYFEVETQLDYSKLSEGGEAGLVMMGGDYACLTVRHDLDGFNLYYVTSRESDSCKIEEETLITHLNVGESIKLYATLTDTFVMSYNFDDNKTTVSKSTEFYPSDHTWVGAKPGLFANSRKLTQSGSASFDYFTVRNING